MKKLIAVASLLFGLFVGSSLIHASVVYAANAAISPKASFPIAYTTTASTITASPSTLYEVTLGTGAAGEFVAFFDTVTANNGYNGVGTAVTSGLTSAASGFKTRVYYGSTTTVTQIRFDPPLIFFYGIQAVDSANTGVSLTTYEQGVGSGQ